MLQAETRGLAGLLIVSSILARTGIGAPAATTHPFGIPFHADYHGDSRPKKQNFSDNWRRQASAVFRVLHYNSRLYVKSAKGDGIPDGHPDIHPAYFRMFIHNAASVGCPYVCIYPGRCIDGLCFVYAHQAFLELEAILD